MRLSRIFNQDAGIQFWPVLLANLGEFEFLFFRQGKFLKRCLEEIEQGQKRFQAIRSGGEE